MTHAHAMASLHARVDAAARIAVWLAGPLALLGAHVALLNALSVTRMLAFIALLFLWMKAVVAFEYRCAGGRRLSTACWIAWALLWPGMRPQRMLNQSRGGGSAFLARGLALAAGGVLLVAAARWTWLETSNRWLATVPLLVGLSLILHYGLFNIVTGGWRYAGVDVRALFRNPLASTSLRDFWMRRWNVAFSEMCQESIGRATRPLGSRVQIALVFLFSGLLHEAAISLPVQAGYGLPTVYFALHGIGVLFERRWLREGSIAARVFAALLIVAPLPLVFHLPFLEQIIWPIIGIAPWKS